MSEGPFAAVRGAAGQVLAFARSTEPRAAMSRRAVIIDVAFAGLVLVAALRLTAHDRSGVMPEVAAVAMAVPLAVRRRFPLAAFLILLLGVLVTRQYATDLSFLAVILAAYSAAVYSRFRGAALLSVAPAGLLLAVAFWGLTPGSRGGGSASATPKSVSSVHVGPTVPKYPYRFPWLEYFPVNTPWRVPALLAFASLATIAVVGGAVYAVERIRRLQAEHEAETRRALELERSRIAGELHDVVTHNVSVMIVQAGAARQILAESPGAATQALLAVEASGRTAMTELRHLLGLLSPSPEPGEAQDAAIGGPAGHDLQPQPGLAQLPALIDRLREAGLPVDLEASDVPELPPSLDLAAFRVVQESLTNVIKHAGKPKTSVKIGYHDGVLVMEIADTGRLIPVAGPIAPGPGRGLFGLRQRMKLYRGELDAGPRPGGGWRVRARVPLELPPAAAPDPERADSAGPAPQLPPPAAPASAPAGAASITPLRAGQP